MDGGIWMVCQMTAPKLFQSLPLLAQCFLRGIAGQVGKTLTTFVQSILLHMEKVGAGQ